MAPVDEKSILQHVPEPPEIRYPGHPGIPEEVQEAWRQTYARELKRQLSAAGAVEPGPAHHQAAHVEASKTHLSVDHPETYEEALALPRWKYLAPPREVPELDGNGNATGRNVLRGLTIDGKALRGPKGRKGIPVPVKKAKPQLVTTDLAEDAGAGNGEANGKGKGKGRG